MKITDAYTKSQVWTPAINGIPGAKPSVGTVPAHQPPKDGGRVQVSAQAKALEAKSAGDSEKIERLKSAISDGSFKVDASKIASKLTGEGEPEE